MAMSFADLRHRQYGCYGKTRVLPAFYHYALSPDREL